METTREQRKDIAVNLMKKLGIFEQYVKDFEKQDYVCYFDRFAGFWDFQDEELFAKRKELEEKYDFTVYAMTHEFVDDMEMYSMLIVPNDTESQVGLLFPLGGGYNAFAYVYNKTYPDLSEFGDVFVSSRFGGIRRVA